MGIVTTSSETAFARSPEANYEIDAYHAAIARELDALDDGAR